MKKLSNKALKWIRIFHITSIIIWALSWFLVVWLGIAKIPMIIALIVMNTLTVIRNRNE